MARSTPTVKKQRVQSTVNTKKSPHATPKPPVYVNMWRTISTRYTAYLLRRPHRSFQRTRRRDYVRSLELPGYWAFSAYVLKTLFTYKKLFGLILLFYVGAAVVLVGLASQDTYSQLSTLLDNTASGWDSVGKASLLLLTSLSGGLNTSFTEAQQIYSALLLLLVWLAVVWILRAVLSGNIPKFRDALYNSGAPIVSTAVVLLILIVQLVPIALAIVMVSVGIRTEMFDSPTMSLILSVVALGLGVLSIYWVTSTVIALVVVTLPGMYPWRAIQTAGDLVIGRRIRIVLRLGWMIVSALIFSIVVLLPIILLDRAVKHAWPVIEWMPIVPVVMAFTGSALVVWSATYVYLLYRKIVEDDASPA